MKERVVWVDWAKTLCIFFVVIGHVGPSFIKPFVYAFHVPAFFVISGYLYKKTNWCQTLISFLIPIVAFSIVNLFLNYVLYGTLGNNTLFVYKLDDARPLFTGLWFLEVLYVGRLLLGDAGFSYVRDHYKLFFVATIVLSFIIDVFEFELTWYITRIIQCFPFLCLGIYLKEKDFFSNIPKTKGTIATAIGGGYFVRYSYSYKSML